MQKRGRGILNTGQVQATQAERKKKKQQTFGPKNVFKII